MAEVIRYTDPDVVGGLGDGTSWANAYDDIITMLAAEETDLVSASDTFIGKFRASSNSADNAPGPILIDGWTTNATYFPTFELDEEKQDPTSWDTDVYRISMTAGRVDISNDYVVWKSIQVETTYRRCIYVTGDEVMIDSCVMRADTTYAAGMLTFAGSATTCYAKNNILYGYGTNGFYGGILVDNGTAYLHNNTIVDMTNIGIWVSLDGTCYISNNCLFNCNDDYYDAGGGFSGNNNSYSEGADPASNGVDISGDAGTDLFADYNNDDFAVKNSSSSLYQAGADLDSHATLPVTDDIAGDSRHASTPCIGADELSAAGTNPHNPLGHPLVGVFGGPIGGII